MKKIFTPVCCILIAAIIGWLFGTGFQDQAVAKVIDSIRPFVLLEKHTNGMADAAVYDFRLSDNTRCVAVLYGEGVGVTCDWVKGMFRGSK